MGIGLMMNLTNGTKRAEELAHLGAKLNPLPHEVLTSHGLTPDEWYLLTFGAGLVVAEREENGYDDSDFYATLYNPMTDEFEEHWVATTRGWTYLNGSRIDAHPDLIDLYHERRRLAAKEFAARRLEKGKTVRIDRGKKFLGELGKVFWYGPDKFNRYAFRAGVELLNGTKLFTDAYNLTVIT